MQKAVKTTRIKLRPLRLYPRDLREVIDGVLSMGNFDVKIKTSEYAYDDVDEFLLNEKLNSDRVFDLSVYGTDLDSYRQISIFFGKISSSISVTSSYSSDHIIVKGLSDLLNSKRISLWYLRSFKTLLVGLIIYLLSVFIYYINNKVHNVYEVCIMAVGSLLMLTQITFDALFKHSAIFLVERSALSGFWGTHRSDVVKGAAGALTGSLITLLAQHLSK